MRPRDLLKMLKSKTNPLVYYIKHEHESRRKRRSDAVSSRRTDRFRFQAKPSQSGAAKKRAKIERKRRRKQQWSKSHKAQ